MRYVRMRLRGGGLEETVHAVNEQSPGKTLCGFGLGYNGSDCPTEDTPTCLQCRSLYERENPLLKYFPTARQKTYTELLSWLPPVLRREVKDYMRIHAYGGGAKLVVLDREFDEHFETIKKIIEDAYPLKESGEQGV